MIKISQSECVPALSAVSIALMCSAHCDHTAEHSAGEIVSSLYGFPGESDPFLINAPCIL